MTQYPVPGIHLQSSGLLQRAWVTALAPPSAAHIPCLLSSCSAAFHDLFMPSKPNQCYMGDSYTVRNVVAMVVAFFSLPSSLPFPLFLSPHFPLWDKSVEKFSYYSSGLALGFSGFRTAKKYISALYKHPVSDTCYSSVPRHVFRMSSRTSHICSASLSELLSFSYMWCRSHS